MSNGSMTPQSEQSHEDQALLVNHSEQVICKNIQEMHSFAHYAHYKGLQACTGNHDEQMNKECV